MCLAQGSGTVLKEGCASVNKGDKPLTLDVSSCTAPCPDSCSLKVECKVGGKSHSKTDTTLGPTAYKYREGSVKRTLERDLKEPALAEGHAYSMLACEMIAVCFRLFLDCMIMDMCHGHLTTHCVSSCVCHHVGDCQCSSAVIAVRLALHQTCTQKSEHVEKRCRRTLLSV